MNLFSRRKNSHPSDDRAAVQKSQDPSVVGRDINIYTGAPVRTMMRLHKNDGSDDLSSSSSPPPSATAGGIIHAPNMARIHTAFSPVDDSEKPPPSSAGISRLNSDTNAVARPGSNDYLHYTQQPVPKIHQPSPVRAVRPLQQHCPQLSYTSDSVSIPGVSMPPTPITSAITPTKKPFRFPATAAGDRLPISPPVSPESPMVYSYGPMDAGGSITPVSQSLQCYRVSANE